MRFSDWMLFGAAIGGPVLGSLILLIPIQAKLDQLTKKHQSLVDLVNRELPIEVSRDGKTWVKLRPKSTT